MYDGNYSDGMQNNSQEIKQRKPSKREVIEYFKQMLNSPELEIVDEPLPEVTRHICLGGTRVEILKRQVYNMVLGNGEVIPMEYYQCMNCGKIILNRDFM